MANPYEPANATSSERNREFSIVRGIAVSIPLGAVGYALPFALVGVYNLIVYRQHAFPDGFLGPIIDLHRDLSRFNVGYLSANIGCALLFSLSAIMTFAPARSCGMVRALMRVGFACLVGVVLMGSATKVLALNAPRHELDPYGPARLAIFASIPLCYTVVNLLASSALKTDDEP